MRRFVQLMVLCGVVLLLASVAIRFLTRVAAPKPQGSPATAAQLRADAGPTLEPRAVVARVAVPLPEVILEPAPSRAVPLGDGANKAPDPVDDLPAEVHETRTIPEERLEAYSEGLRNAVRAKRSEIRECYEGWLSQRPNLQGAMMLSFSIAADDAGTGTITHIALVDGGVGHVLMEGCVMNAFQDIRFEVPEGGGTVEVRYPIEFLQLPTPADSGVGSAAGP